MELTVLALVPFAFLVGLLRSRFGRAEAVTSVVSRMGEGAGRTALRDALAEALGDPGLELAYWVPETSSYVDSDGRPAALPEAGSGKFATEVEHDGQPVAAIIHDASLEDERDLVQTVGAAAALTLRTSASTPSCGRRSPSFGPRAHASCRPDMSSGGGSSETCTTALSSG